LLSDPGRAKDVAIGRNLVAITLGERWLKLVNAGEMVLAQAHHKFDRPAFLPQNTVRG
jgi:hypothetical protein